MPFLRYAFGVKRFLLGALGAGIIAAIATATPDANANGRFPESNQIAFSPSDPNLVLMRVTFGLLVSHDRGKTWDWVCERAIGVSGSEDPMYGITTSGAIFGSTFEGLQVSRDGACKWDVYAGELEKQVFIDLAVNPSDKKNVFAFASSYDKQDDAGNLLFRSFLFETKDEQTFTKLAANFDSGLLGHTVDFAQSAPDRIYLTAARDPGAAPRAFLLVSKNRGQTFEETPITLEGTERAVYIAGVDPKNADRLYMRTSNGADKPSRLLVSDDGGKTVRTVFTADNALLGFALSLDGTKVFVGGPRAQIQLQPNMPPIVKPVGIFKANAADLVFTRVNERDVQCLAMAEDGLWACSNEAHNGFVAGLSKDEGVTFEAKLHFCDIRGPLACPDDKNVAECKGDRRDTPFSCAPCWTQQKNVLGCGLIDAGVDGGSGGEGSTEPLADPGGGGCQCSAAPASSLGAFAGFLAFVTGVLALLMRARQKR